MKKDELIKENNELKNTAAQHNKDMLGDDAQLANRQEKIDFTGNDLDIPGRNTPSLSGNKLKIKDEENKLYSQGSQHNNHLEESQNIN